MEAIMLAAGQGTRLSKNDETYRPKCLLQFDGQSLLARHIEILKTEKLEKLTLVVGYRAADIETELSNIGAAEFVSVINNSNYRNGSILSLSCAASAMRSGADILFMDADVLYHQSLVHQLASSTENSHILYDTNFEPGDDPVLLCLKAGQIIEFKKEASIISDVIGEWPGFVKWSSSAAIQIADIIERKLSEGAINLPCEDSFREYLLSPDGKNVDCSDITGLPWIEIDFLEDLDRARNVILPALKA
jgi:choline kinase